MELRTLLILSIGGWGLGRWLLIPWLRSSLEGSRSAQRLARAGLCAGADQFVKLASVAAVTSLAILIIG